MIGVIQYVYVINRYLINNSLYINKIRLLFVTGAILSACVNTEGTLEINGKVEDEFTKEKIAGKNIIIQASIETDGKLSAFDAGQFTTDSLGCFTYTLRKIKDARYYNICLVGDSDYAVLSRRFGHYELEQKAKYLFFSLRKLVDLTIIINRKSKIPAWDTLSLSWKSDGISGRFLYPYKIDNFGKPYDLDLTTVKELRWIGGNVNSIVKTKVFSDKKTKIFWDLDRNGKRNEITDTITCKRDLSNIVYFTY